VVLTAGGSTITVASGTTVPLTIQNDGTGNSFVVNDVASDTTPFVVTADGNVGINSTSLTASGGYGSITIDGSSGSLWSAKVAGTETFRIQPTASSTTVNGIANVPIVINTNNAERMRIDSAGNVGIGTSSPLADLHIGSSTTVSDFRMSNSAASTVLNMYTASNDIVINNATATGYLNIGTGNATRIYIDQAGNSNFMAAIQSEAGGAGNITNRVKSGYFQNAAPTTADGWPVTGSWHHLTTNTHSNTGNYYSQQVASDFFDSLNTWYRATNGSGTTPWHRQLLSTILISSKTAAYTLIATDVGTLVEINMASANTLTVPTNASVAYPIGAQINLLQTGAGQVTVGGAGVTINGTPGLKLRAQWSAATLIKRGTDTWVLIGDLSA
jgi:hypothetical protein